MKRDLRSVRNVRPARGPHSRVEHHVPCVLVSYKIHAQCTSEIRYFVDLDIFYFAVTK